MKRIAFEKFPSTEHMMAREKAMHNNKAGDNIDDFQITTIDEDNLQPNAVFRYGLREYVPLFDWTHLTADCDNNDEKLKL